MLGRSCPRCGRRLRGGTACPQCDAPSPDAAGSTATRVLIPHLNPSTQSRELPSARRALSSVFLGAAFGLAGGLFGLTFLFYRPVLELQITDGLGSFSISSWSLASLLVLAAVQPAFGVVEALAFRSAFDELGKGDPDFLTPSRFSWLLLAGELAVLSGALLGVTAAYSDLRCAGSGSTLASSVSATCLPLGWALLAAALIDIGAVLGFAGLIGITFGIWRLGNRTKDSAFQIAGLFVPLPYVSVVGYAAVLAMTLRHWTRARSGATPREHPRDPRSGQGPRATG